MDINLIPITKSKSKIKPKNCNKIFPVCDYVLYFDGYSKGNPGPSAIGAVIYNNGDEIWGGSNYIGDNKINNQAEYSALILGLKNAIELNISHLIVFGTSQLVINQINKVYKVKNKLLFELYEETISLIHKFNYIEFTHIYREDNKRANELTNLALIDNFRPTFISK
jgi:ribonuclease HI